MASLPSAGRLLLFNAVDRADWPAALSHARTCIREDPDDAETMALLALSMAHVGEGNRRQSRKLAEDARARAPDDPNVLALVAETRIRLGDLDDADTTLDGALRIAPEMAHLHSLGCVIAARRLRTDEMARRIEALAGIAPDDIAVEFHRGHLALLKSDRWNGRIHLLNVLRRDPEHAATHRMLAHLELYEGNLSAARAHAVSAARISPVERFPRNLIRVLDRRTAFPDRMLMKLAMSLAPGSRNTAVMIAVPVMAAGLAMVERFAGLAFCFVLLAMILGFKSYRRGLERELDAPEDLVVLSARY